jgi:hypothetical protein
VGDVAGQARIACAAADPAALNLRAVLPPLLLLFCVPTGYGLLLLSRLSTLLEEGVVFGAVLGAMAVTGSGFLLALWFGFSAVTVVAGPLAAAAVSAVGWYGARARVAAQASDFNRRWRLSLRDPEHPWPLLLLLAICWPFIVVFMAHSLVMRPDGLYAEYNNIWGDWALHLTYAASFAYGGNLPPQLPIDPGNRLAYHFQIDFLAASLVRLGSSLPASLALTSGLLALAFPAVMYFATLRFVGSRAAAVVAVLVFTLSGGLGFVYALGDIGREGFAFFMHPPREYDRLWELNYQWPNWTLANLVPQRSTLFGFSTTLIVASSLWRQLRQPAISWAPFACMGIASGALPTFDLYGYLTTVVLMGFWAAFRPRREWIAFFGPALGLGVPGLLWVAPRASPDLHFQIGWMADTAGHHDGFLWFWLKNTGIFIPLLLLAQFWRRAQLAGFGLYFGPLWLWWIVPNLFLGFQPWDWSSTKIFVYWALFGSIMVAAALVAIARTGAAGFVLAPACLVVLVLSGVLDVSRAANPAVSAIRLEDNAALRLGDWARTHTDSRATFVIAQVHNHPVPVLAGRRVVVGYTGWLAEYRLTDFDRKVEDSIKILRGDPAAPELIRKYGVRYVVVGPVERRGPFYANDDYWRRTGKRVYDADGYAVYATG